MTGPDARSIGAAVAGDPADGALRTRLRPVRPAERGLLDHWGRHPCSPYDDWSGPPAPGVLSTALLRPPPGGDELVVTDGTDTPIGTVSWMPVLYAPTPGSQAYDLGISLQAAARGQGHGTRAQQMLARLLFATTGVHRLQASTDVTNVAEQRALERAGFLREGVLRGAQWRQGAWHDLVAYGRLRDD